MQFLDLPGEIRTKIYGFLFDQTYVIWQQDGDRSNIYGEHVNQIDQSLARQSYSITHPFAILRVSRICYREASNLVFSRCIVRIGAYTGTVSGSYLQSFNFFRATVTRLEIHNLFTSSFVELPQFPALKELTILIVRQPQYISDWPGEEDYTVQVKDMMIESIMTFSPGQNVISAALEEEIVQAVSDTAVIEYRILYQCCLNVGMRDREVRETWHMAVLYDFSGKVLEAGNPYRAVYVSDWLGSSMESDRMLSIY